jgi:hypothetical protein
MTIGTRIKTRILVAIVCGAAVAAVAAPAALADPPQGHRGPSANAPLRIPDALDRYRQNRLPGIRDDRPDGYQSDARGAEIAAVPASKTTADGFGWGEAGIGAAFGFALSLAAIGTLVLATRGRNRMAHS